MWERNIVYATSLLIKPFPHIGAFRCPCITSLENVVAKGEIAHDEQFILIATMISRLFNNRILIEIFPIFVKMFSKSSAADLFFNMEKG